MVFIRPSQLFESYIIVMFTAYTLTLKYHSVVKVNNKQNQKGVALSVSASTKHNCGHNENRNVITEKKLV